MKKKIVLIACSKKKVNHQAKAKDLYTGALFTKSLKYAYSLNADKIFILSAKHHLLSLDKMIEPYDCTLKDKKKKEKEQWANAVIEELRKEANLDSDEFIFLASEDYRKYLIPIIKDYRIPMHRLNRGKQLKFLTDSLK